MTPANPYSAGGLVTDPAMFFGREAELARIRDRLRKGDSSAVVGLRRIGKSSLLYQLASQAGELPAGMVAVYLDLQDGAHHKPLDLLSAALQRLDERLGGRYHFGPVRSLGEFSTAIKQMGADGFQPVLCLDEVEELTDRDVFDDSFFEGLRSLGQQRLLAFVTASGESLDLLIQQGGRTSQFYNIFTNFDLAGLPDEAARALLTRPFSAAGLGAPLGEYVDEVLDLAGRYPFYLQMAAGHLFEARRDGGVLDRGALRQAFARDAERHFRGLWRHLNPDEQAGVRQLAGLQANVRDWDRVRAGLVRCGLAEGGPADPRLFSSVFAGMVRSGELERQRARRPRRGHQHKPKEKAPSMPPLLSYTLVALAAAAASLVIALLLPAERFWFFFVVLTVVLTFILVLADRLTGGQFLDWLSRLFGKWG